MKIGSLETTPIPLSNPVSTPNTNANITYPTPNPISVNPVPLNLRYVIINFKTITMFSSVSVKKKTTKNVF